ncbi:MAG: hypothetical protein GC150_04860 [Rhizobiales bacterium]|nr:hypothetical protein [Hyphomicrobiales bacterium]
MSEQPLELSENDIERLAASPAAAFIVSLDRGELVWGNAAATRLLGLRADERWPAGIDRATPALAALEAAAATRSGLRLPQRLVFWRPRGAIAFLASVRPIRLADASRAVLVLASEPSGRTIPRPQPAGEPADDDPAAAGVTVDPVAGTLALDAQPAAPARPLVLIPFPPGAESRGGQTGRRSDDVATPPPATGPARSLGSEDGAGQEDADAAAMAAIARQIREAASNTGAARKAAPTPTRGSLAPSDAAPRPVAPGTDPVGNAPRETPRTGPRAALHRLLRRAARRNARTGADRESEPSPEAPCDRVTGDAADRQSRSVSPPARVNGTSAKTVARTGLTRPRAGLTPVPPLPTVRPAPIRRASPWRPPAGAILARPATHRNAELQRQTDRPQREVLPAPLAEAPANPTARGEHAAEPAALAAKPPATQQITDASDLTEYLLPLPIAAAVYGEAGCELANDAWRALFSSGQSDWADGWLRALADAARQLAGRAAVRTTELGGEGTRLRCGARLIPGGKVMLLAEELDAGEHRGAAPPRTHAVADELAPATGGAPFGKAKRPGILSSLADGSISNATGRHVAQPAPTRSPATGRQPRHPARPPVTSTAPQAQSLRRIADDALRCSRGRAELRRVRLVRGAIATPAEPDILPLLLRQILIACIDRSVDAAGPEGRVTLSAGPTRTSAGAITYADLRVSAQPSGAVIVFESPRASIPATYRIAEDLAAQCGVHLKLETSGPQHLDIVVRIPMRSA